MCMQCVGASMAAVGAASGIRAYVAMRAPVWMTPKRLKLITGVLLGGALIAASISFS